MRLKPEGVSGSASSVAADAAASQSSDDFEINRT